VSGRLTIDGYDYNVPPNVRVEVERLRAENERAEVDAENWAYQAGRAVAEAGRLRAENERLRQRVSTLEQDNALLRKRLSDWLAAHDPGLFVRLAGDDQ